MAAVPAVPEASAAGMADGGGVGGGLGGASRVQIAEPKWGRMWARMPLVAAATRMTLATGLCLAVHGCEDVTGGAVELSWKLRPASGDIEDKFVSCDAREIGVEGPLPVTRIRLEWEVGDQKGFDDWECDDNHGVTGFDLPEGYALLTVKPVCEGGDATPESYIAPAAEQRRVIVGDTVSLGAVELVVVVTGCDGDCICQ